MIFKDQNLVQRKRMAKKEPYVPSRIKSFGFALAGMRDILRTEHNARIHALFTLLVVLLASWLHIGEVQFTLIIIVITLVWITEALNTVFELVIDIVSPAYTETARRAKDIAAAAVLIASLGAFLTGIAILLPPLLAKFGF
jgi:diacylglycerol kinase